jgi:exodeoxyribonuclease V alpha subunit
MHGGVKVYRGAPAAARNYLDADRSRADDYYLAEGTGVACRFTAGPDAPLVELRPLTGQGYEAWVAGLDPDTDRARGRLRTDPRAVRFVEVTINGPKSWSLAAELHPDVAAAYEAAQDRAAAQVIGWLAEHATTRVGPRAAQVAVPVDRIEAVTVRHYTSRAGDPHRHLHLQMNARVFAAGMWRGLDTVAVRDCINAINGIGHAAVACDPDFRSTLAAHGYTLNNDGEIEQLTEYVGPFSRRAAQIATNIDRYETEWRTAHPGEQPGPGLWRAWDTRAWADGRPDKVIPEPGAEVHGRWLRELAALGYRDPDRPVQLALSWPGRLDRDMAVAEVVARLGSGRSAWNAADVRGEVEHLLARSGIVTDPAVRLELAEDLTARALARCVPLTEQRPPQHVRVLTSQRVLDVEADLIARLAVRGAEPADAANRAGALALNGHRLDPGQSEAVAALTGSAALVVIEGAAGAGKTTLLAAAHEQLERQAHRLVVVTPTLKAAKAATEETGARAGSAAWLVYQHGWRWDDTGRWTRLAPGEVDPVTGRVYHGPDHSARLRAGDVLLVDEAGMLDQDIARALLTIADEHAARLALTGDRHQLPAVGRGGVLDLAHRWADPQACVTLDVVHRFTRETVSATGERERVPDNIYADLTLQMRLGENPASVFDALAARGQIAVHGSDHERQKAIAEHAAADHGARRTAAVVVDTCEQAAVLNAAIRDRLATAGVVDDQHTTSARAGQPIGVGDLIATRRNDHPLGVANRDTWTVTVVHRDGALTVTATASRVRVLPLDYVREHVELAYATTAHGAQGDATPTGHLVLGEHTTAASAYVGMTRGCERNTVHLVADDIDDARQQWVTAFARDRADLGPAHAARQAAREAAAYAKPRSLRDVIADLRQAWDNQADADRVLHRIRPVLDRALAAQPRVAAEQAAEQTAWARFQHTRQQLEHARDRLAAADRTLDRTAEHIAHRLRAAWNAQRGDAQADARRIAKGTGRFGRGRSEIADATARLEHWAAAWQPIVGDLNETCGGVVGFALRHPGIDHIDQRLHEHARQQAAAAAQPEHAAHTAAVAHAEQHSRTAFAEWRELTRQHSEHTQPADHLATPETIERMRNLVSASDLQLEQAQRHLTALHGEPAVANQPDADGWLATQHAAWQHERGHSEAEQNAHAIQRDREARPTPARLHEHWQPGPEINRGPSLGR